MNEALVLRELGNYGVPSHLHTGLVNYLVHRVRTGRHLECCLANDFVNAAVTCSYPKYLPLVAKFISNVVPADAKGSYEAVEKWVNHG